ncbi:hypothetical protein [Pseudonocardia pini]|uniref:hypothetical protein n=1 Tax=Pseudonocardia pini TaxID=2758030 RepID=UPI0015F10746|nr:hypothetical protein [Pseudonocardia pini]
MPWFLLVTGLVTLAIGLWAGRNARSLVPRGMTRRGRQSQEGVLLRGAVTLTVLGLVFAGFGAYLLVLV